MLIVLSAAMGLVVELTSGSPMDVTFDVTSARARGLLPTAIRPHRARAVPAPAVRVRLAADCVGALGRPCPRLKPIREFSLSVTAENTEGMAGE